MMDAVLLAAGYVFYIIFALRIFYAPLLLAVGWAWLFSNIGGLKNIKSLTQIKRVKLVVICFLLNAILLFAGYLGVQIHHGCKGYNPHYIEIPGTSPCGLDFFESGAFVLLAGLSLSIVQSLVIWSAPDKASNAPCFRRILLKWWAAWVLAIGSFSILNLYYCWHHGCYL